MNASNPGRALRRIAHSLLLAAAAIGAGAAAAPLTGTSDAVRSVAGWIAASGDAHDRPFAIVDKRNASLFVFDSSGVLIGTSPVLLGLARGDDSSPGIGTRPLSAIRPAERTTPAGRFEAAPDINAAGHAIVWIDYAAAISMHAVVPGSPTDHRLQRLATPSPDDNRISYGCINIPAAFFTEVVQPDFAKGGIVYILPEVRPLRDVFRMGAGRASGQP
ncbi:L,D-transpeptidase [Polymorphobacter megasporae]|uniref:L,D-transpeptidase n=1 Tax=Glacieibacterium megasporae TaxID=2835787 RepID=UPI002103B1E8|nr:L,D-transpeptidase [Polymorphobacter megasporae]